MEAYSYWGNRMPAKRYRTPRTPIVCDRCGATFPPRSKAIGAHRREHEEFLEARRKLIVFRHRTMQDILDACAVLGEVA